MLEIGPFNIYDVEQIKAVFERKGVEYEVIVDEDMKNRLNEEFNQRVRETPRAAVGTLDLRYIFFSFEGTQLEKVKDDLERFGVAPHSDGSFELGEEE